MVSKGSALLILLFASTLLCAQNQLGLRMETYAGISSVAHNPAAMSSFPLRWDLNIIEGYGSGFTNYGYFEDTRLMPILDGLQNGSFSLADQWNQETTPAADDLIIDFPTGARRRYAQLSAGVMGPAFQYNFSDRHSIGFSTRLRVFGGTRTIPAALNYPNYYNAPFFEDLRVTPFHGSFLAVQQYGLHYAYRLPMDDGALAFGVSLHNLVGNEGMYVDNRRAYNLQKVPGDSILTSGIDLEYGYTLPVETDYRPEAKGRGFAVDLGVQYTSSDGPDEPHRWRVGASIMDLGAVQFRETAQQYRIQTDDQVRFIGADSYSRFEELTELSELNRVLSHELFGDSLTTLSGNEFSILMPAAFSLQGDVGLTSWAYLGGFWRQSLTFSGRTGHQANVLAIVPRVEHRWFSVSLPVSWVEYDQLNVGLAARLGFVVIGSDHLSVLLTEQNVRGADFYAAVKVNPFRLLGNQTSAKHKKRGGRSKVKCPVW